MIRDFIVNISRLTKPVERASDFGTVLIMDTEGAKEFTEYKSLDLLKVDYADTTDVYKMAKTIFEQDVKPVKVAVGGVTDVTAVTPVMVTDFLDANLDRDWFALTCVDNTDAFITALVTWADTKEKMYFATSQSKTAPSLKESDNAVVLYHETAGNYIAEGLASYLMTAPMGGVTAKFKKINNVTVSSISDTDLAELHSINGGTYVTKFGLPQTSEGKTTSGEWIDVVLGSFYIKREMEKDLAILAYNTPKLSYDSQGISLMVGVVEKRLSQASDIGVIGKDASGNPLYSVSFITREETSLTDISNRQYSGLSWTAQISGAIHDGTINGTLTI